MRLIGDLNSLSLYGTTVAPVPGSTLPGGAGDTSCTARRAVTARQRSAGRGEPRELKLHRVGLCQVAAGVVVAASLRTTYVMSYQPRYLNVDASWIYNRH